jgi:hypothetical protein
MTLPTNTSLIRTRTCQTGIRAGIGADGRTAGGVGERRDERFTGSAGTERPEGDAGLAGGRVAVRTPGDVPHEYRPRLVPVDERGLRGDDGAARGGEREVEERPIGRGQSYGYVSVASQSRTERR